jgi:hypothetical protein
MKMSLRLMTCSIQSDGLISSEKKFSNTHILMPQVLEQLQLAVGTLGQDGCAERLHDLLDGNGLVCELILCRTKGVVRGAFACGCGKCSPDKTKCSLGDC